MSDKSNDQEERDQLILLIKAQSDALRDFIAETDRHLKKVDARLDKHWKAIRELSTNTSNLSEQLSDLDDKISELDERYFDLQERVESLEGSLDLDGESLAESLKELTDKLEELEKFVRRRLK